jgi:acyl carrier protein
MNDIEFRIRAFIAENFLFREERSQIGETESLLDAGLIDSTGVLELVGYLEKEFAIHMEDAEIVPANLDSVRAIVGFVSGKLKVRAAA